MATLYRLYEALVLYLVRLGSIGSGGLVAVADIHYRLPAFINPQVILTAVGYGLSFGVDYVKHQVLVAHVVVAHQKIHYVFSILTLLP